MEDEIELGEYVRTKNGLIGTLIEISEAGSGVRYEGEIITDEIFSIYTKPYTEVCIRLKDRDIDKHSKDIIDLIEVGDYVNGYKVIDVMKRENAPSGKCVHIESDMNSSFCTFWAEDIKSIVTKEQFESVKYEV